MFLSRLNQVLGGSVGGNDYFLINHFRANGVNEVNTLDAMLSYMNSQYFTYDSKPDWAKNNGEVNSDILPFPLKVSLLSQKDIRLEKGDFSRNIIKIFQKLEKNWDSYQEYLSELKFNLESINKYLKHYNVEDFYYFINIDDWDFKSNKISNFFKEFGTDHLPFIEHFYFCYMPLKYKKEFITVQLSFE